MHDLLIQGVFYGFAGLTLISALMVVTQNNPVRSVLFLVLAFFASAVLWIMLSAEFLALLLVLVYVGAVMTLFLFVVMMLNIDVESRKSHLMKYLPFGLILVSLLTSLLLVATPKDTFEGTVKRPAVNVNELIAMESENAPKVQSNTEEIGLALYTKYVFAFELAAVLLLVAIISAITLAHRPIVRSKQQAVLKQIMTRRKDRLRLVKMKPENYP